jgi:hypothetical protein
MLPCPSLSPDRYSCDKAIDAFAGTGDRVAKRQQTATLMEMPDLDEMTKGSARIALEIDPTFARYVYIEKRQRCRIEEMLPPVSGAVPAPRRADDRRS